MPRGCLTVFTACTDPAREAEYNAWYSNVHLPDLQQTDGCVGARRFRQLSHSGKIRYMALYEFDSDDLRATRSQLMALALRALELGRHIECITGAPPGRYEALWEEIDASEFPLTSEPQYPTDVPELRLAIEASI